MSVIITELEKNNVQNVRKKQTELTHCTKTGVEQASNLRPHTIATQVNEHYIHNFFFYI